MGHNPNDMVKYSIKYLREGWEQEGVSNMRTTTGLRYAARLALVALAAAAFVHMGAAQQQAELASPGQTPGSILYGLDRAAESVSLALTFSSEGKAQKKLQYAEERLSEARAVAEQGDTQAAEDLEQEYSDNIDEAATFGQNIADAAQRQDIESVISQATTKHAQVLEQQEVDPGEPGYDAKRKAEDVTVETENDPVEKARKQADAAGNRANEADRLASRGDTQRAEQAAQEYEQEMQDLEQIGQQVSDAAQQRDIQTVVATATQAHQQVLQRVYNQVPEQARDAISRAMEASKRGHEQAVQSLQQSGGLPGGVQEAIPGPGGNATERMSSARDLMEQGRQAVTRGKQQLNQNNYQEARQAFAEAESLFDRAAGKVVGLEDAEAQRILENARNSRSGADNLERSVEAYMDGDEQAAQEYAGDAQQDFEQTDSGSTAQGGTQ